MCADFSYDRTANSVHASLDAALAAIPPGKRGALLARTTGETASLMVAARINGTWQLAGGAAWDGHGAPKGEVALVGAW